MPVGDGDQEIKVQPMGIVATACSILAMVVLGLAMGWVFVFLRRALDLETLMH